jgi:hypothetical protein
LLSSAPPVRAAVVYDDIRISVEPEPKGKATHGYAEHAILVTNSSGERFHRVTLATFTDERGTYGQDLMREIRRTVDVGPGATVRVSLLQPAQPALYRSGLKVFIDEREQHEKLALNFATFQPSSGGRPGWIFRGSGPPLGPLVLLGHNVPADFPERAGRWISVTTPAPPRASAPGGLVLPLPAEPPHTGPVPPRPTKSGAVTKEVLSGPGSFGGVTASPAGVPEFIKSETPLALWSSTWLPYSRYDGIVLMADELQAAPSPVQGALWQYVECGGVLLLLGSASVPDGWKRTRVEKHGLTIYEPAFGRCLVSADSDYSRWSQQRGSLVRSSWNETALPWDKARTVAEVHQLFPVVDDVGIPVRGLFVLMLVFTAIIGPLNLTLLSRKKKRIWMLWTVPVISATTCLAVFAYMLLVEGWSGHLRTETLTVLDETSHRAATLGWTAFYSPLTPGDGLHFGYETEVLSQGALAEPWRRGGGRVCTLDWTADQHLSRGWMTARVPSHFLVRKSEVRRERVTLGPGKDGALTMVNGLGTNVLHFWYADEHGQIHAAEQVSPGSQAVLVRREEPVPNARNPLRELFTADWLQSMERLAKKPAAFLPPRCYLAELDDTPFVEDGLGGTKHRKCRSLVLGILREPGDEN